MRNTYKKVMPMIAIGAVLAFLVPFPQTADYVTTVDQAVLEIASAEEEFALNVDATITPLIEVVATL